MLFGLRLQLLETELEAKFGFEAIRKEKTNCPQVLLVYLTVPETWSFLVVDIFSRRLSSQNSFSSLKHLVLTSHISSFSNLLKVFALI